jgi:hypothetical protein
MFNPEDGSARDIVEWRQAVRDDTWYAGLLEEHYPEFHRAVVEGTNEEVQNLLRMQHRLQRQASKSEL